MKTYVFLPLYAIMIIMVILGSTGCGSDNNTVTPAPTDVLGVTTVDGTTIRLTSGAPLRVGYSPIAVEAQRPDGAKPQKITVRTVMPSHGHGCPVTKPIDGPMYGDTYRCGIIFGMPGSWQLHTTIRYSDSDSVVAVFAVTVDASDLVRNIRVDDERGYVVTMIPPPTWKIGANDVHFYVYQTSDVREYQPVDDCSMEITPWMPSMSHGSLGNVNPSLIDDGLYKGSVNITMSGDWTVTNKISKPYGILTNLTFDVAVP